MSDCSVMIYFKSTVVFNQTDLQDSHRLIGIYENIGSKLPSLSSGCIMPPLKYQHSWGPVP